MPRLLCFIPAPKQNTPPHNKTPNLQRPQTNGRTPLNDVTTNQKRRRPPAQTRQPVYVEVTAQKEVATTTVVSAMALYAYLRHALSGCHETPRPSLPLLSRGLPVNVCLRHTTALIGRSVASLSLAVMYVDCRSYRVFGCGVCCRLCIFCG